MTFLRALCLLAAASVALSATAAARDGPLWPDEAPPQEDPSGATGRLVDRMDWIRAGVVFGGQVERRPMTQIEGKFHLFGMDWGRFYYIPLLGSVGVVLARDADDDGNVAGITFFGGGEIGYVRRWVDDRLMAGVGLGFAGGGRGSWWARGSARRCATATTGDASAWNCRWSGRWWSAWRRN